MEYDELLRMLGEFGWYQRIVFLLVCLLAIPAALNNLVIVFLAAEPDFRCLVPDAELLNLSMSELLNLTVPRSTSGSLDDGPKYDQCLQYARNYTGWTRTHALEVLIDGPDGNQDTLKCLGGWVYNTTTYTSTIVTEWNLVCDLQPLVPTASSVFMAGLLVGVAFFGAISDWFGRKAAIVPSCIGMVVFSVSLSFSPNYSVFVLLRFLCAACSIGVFTTAFVLGIELVGQSWRSFAGIVIEYFWVTGYIVIAGLAYGLRDWRHLALAVSVPQVLLLLMVIFLPESPRWLYSRNKHERGDVIVRHMAKVNKVTIPENINIELKQDAQAYVYDLFRYRRLRWRTLNICFNWFVNSLVYYGLSLSTGQLGGNDYVNFLVSGLVEVPAYVFCQLGLGYIGRRGCLTGTMVAGGVCLLVIVAVPKQPESFHIMRVVFAMLGKLCISASFAVIYVFSAELFPTVVRNVGVSAGSASARLGGIIAPYILTLHSDVGYGAFGVLSLTAGMLALLLPETRNCQLPQTIEEGEYFPEMPPPKEHQQQQDEPMPGDLEQQPQSVQVVGGSYGNGCFANPMFNYESSL